MVNAERIPHNLPFLRGGTSKGKIGILSALAGEIRVRGKVLNPESHPHLYPLPSRERRDENNE